MPHLDPTLDLVFKLLLTREPVLLCDMLEGILARPIRDLTLLNPRIPGEAVSDRSVIFDIRARLDGGRRIDLEMQRTLPPGLASRLVFYAARDYGSQLNRGDEYHLLTPTTGIMWLTKTLVPAYARLHSIIRLREDHTQLVYGDQIAFHLLQLPYLRPSRATGYTATVERWARFFANPDDASMHRLASEHPIMSLAMQTLTTISLDPEAQRLAQEREIAVKIHRFHLASSRAEGRAEGEAAGKAAGKAELLLELLGQRFGPPSAATRARVATASSEQLDRWARRLLTAPTPGDIFAS